MLVRHFRSRLRALVAVAVGGVVLAPGMPNQAGQVYGAQPAQVEIVNEDDDDAYARNALQRLKLIGIALHNYHDVMKSFPPAVVMGRDGKTPYSWRVALLPFLEGDARQIYDRYRMDEPWNSEHNQKLIAEGAKFFRIGDDLKDTSSGFYLLLGPGSGFERTKRTSIRAITDGTSRTIAVVEAQRPIPWTKPEDLEFTADKPLPKLGGHFEGGFLCLLMDASTHFIPDDTGEDVLRAMISKSGREMVLNDENDRWILQKRN